MSERTETPSDTANRTAAAIASALRGGFTTSECRDAECRAPIVWAITGSGKRMPVDADPHPDGNVMLTGHGDSVVATVVNPNHPPLGGWGPLHHSHFTTCPAADRWRTKKK